LERLQSLKNRFSLSAGSLEIQKEQEKTDVPALKQAGFKELENWRRCSLYSWEESGFLF
jgi:hypothetical protein